MKASFPACTWAEQTGAGLTISAFSCPNQKLVADEALPGFQMQQTETDGAQSRYPAIQVFAKAADAPIDAVLDAVRPASPGLFTAGCVLTAGHNDPSGKTFLFAPHRRRQGRARGVHRQQVKHEFHALRSDVPGRIRRPHLPTSPRRARQGRLRGSRFGNPDFRYQHAARGEVADRPVWAPPSISRRHRFEAISKRQSHHNEWRGGPNPVGSPVAGMAWTTHAGRETGGAIRRRTLSPQDGPTAEAV